MQQDKYESKDHVLFIDKRKQPVWFDFEAFDRDLDPFEFRVYAQIARRCSGYGQCWEQQGKMAEACRMSERKFRDALRRLESLGMIQSIPVPTRIEEHWKRRGWALTPVSNWSSPAPHAADTDPSPAPHAADPSFSPAPHAADLLSTDQEESKKEDKSIPTVPRLPPPPALSLAHEWHDWATASRPYLASSNPQSFAKAIAQLQARHSIKDEGMRKVLRFIQRDPFWSEQALSPCGLLKRSKNGLYKMENLLASMKTDRSWQNEAILSAPEFEDVNF